MNRTVNYKKKQVEYVIPERELMKKLGIAEPLKGAVSYSTVHRTLKIFCELPEAEK